MSKPFAYIDTSALVKRFINEARSLEVEAFLIAGTHRSVLPSLSLTELKAVLRRRQRDPNPAQQISPQTVQLAYNQVLMEMAQNTWHFEPVTERIFTYAGELVDQLNTQLGTLDALHLACAKTARCSLMVSAHKQLLRASAEVGLQTFDLS